MRGIGRFEHEGKIDLPVMLYSLPNIAICNVCGDKVELCYTKIGIYTPTKFSLN